MGYAVMGFIYLLIGVFVTAGITEARSLDMNFGIGIMMVFLWPMCLIAVAGK